MRSRKSLAHPIARVGQPSHFGHPDRVVSFWRQLVRASLPVIPTPFYLFSIEPIREALADLAAVGCALPIPCRHWLSCKTQPIRPLLVWWRRQGFGIEVVSEFELLAALDSGFASSEILVNGPAKHRWLAGYPLPGLRVNFDSPREARALLPLATRCRWSVGIRCQTRLEVDLDSGLAAQFGMSAAEAVPLLRTLRRSKVRLETIHFHLRTNVTSPDLYERAIQEVAAICEEAEFRPKHLDCGGGFPAPHVTSQDGARYDAAFDLGAMRAVYQRTVRRFPSLKELWLENGRFVSARSGVLVLRILDAKDRGSIRHLICDGGRTMNALVSQWETHECWSIPTRPGPRRLTAICGPTCMGFDRLSTRPMARSIQVGDYLVWLEAGAYHIPWETRFSHGVAAVAWHEAGRVTLVRPAETFVRWWKPWKLAARGQRQRSAHASVLQPRGVQPA